MSPVCPERAPQTPSELAAIVSFREYSRELMRWESWEGDISPKDTLLHL